MPADVAEADFDTADGSAGTEESESRPRRVRRLVAIGSGAFLLLAAAGYGAAWSLGLFGASEEQARQPVYFELPEMTVNLSSVEERDRYLRLQVALEMEDPDARAAVEQVLPRVLDAFQVYLRELRSTDLEGSAGLFRLKEELVRRVNLAIYPAEIDGVVFKEIIVQ